jgi:hypothetical protein
LSGATSRRFTLLAAISSSRPHQVDADAERTKNEREDDVPPPHAGFDASVDQCRASVSTGVHGANESRTVMKSSGVIITPCLASSLCSSIK